MAFKFTTREERAGVAARDRLEREQLERVTIHALPPLEAVAVAGVHDWTREIGELHGVPVKLSDGWGIDVYPTVQQMALLDERRAGATARADYSTAYLEGLPAVSVDKSGRSRSLTVVDASYGWATEILGGHLHLPCATVARTPGRDERHVPLKPIQAGGDVNVSPPPVRPSAGGRSSSSSGRAHHVASGLADSGR